MKQVFIVCVALIILAIVGGSLYQGDDHTGLGGNSQAVTTMPAVAAVQGLPIDRGSSTTDDETIAAVPVRQNRTKGYTHPNVVSPNAVSHAGDATELSDNRGNEESLAIIASGNEATATNEPATVNDIPVIPAVQIITDPLPLAVTERKDITSFHRHMVHFAPEVGISGNSFYNNNSSSMMRAGFYAGAIVDIGFSKHWALQPGLRYSLKGVQTEHTTADNTMKVDTKDKIDLNYLELPVDLVAKFGSRENVRFIVGAGPYVSYLLQAQDKYTATTTSFGTPTERTTASSTGSVASNQVTKEGQISLAVGNGSNGTTSANVNGINSIRSLDVGLNGFVGLETPGGFYAKAGSEVGMMDIQHNTNGSYSGRNYNFFISLGCFIGNRK